jgi:hypothetical protein
MSGMLMNEELKSVESRYGIDLGHLPGSGEDDQSQYYPQFEQAVRAEASKMSAHYEVFYCLETSIRRLLMESMIDAEGANWWDSARVPPKIKSDVEERMRREVDSGVTRRSDNLIDYTNFGELSVIITHNWDVFEPIFNSKRAVEKVMKDLNLLRGPIAHCCPMTDDEIDRLRLAVKDWFRMMA